MKRPQKQTDEALHCMCGRLVARWVGGAIEIRCQRCKRTLRLALSLDGAIVVDTVGEEPGK